MLNYYKTDKSVDACGAHKKTPDGYNYVSSDPEEYITHHAILQNQ